MLDIYENDLHIVFAYIYSVIYNWNSMPLMDIVLYFS